MNFADSFECLIFEETLFTVRFQEKCMDKWPNDSCLYFVELLMSEKFGEESEGLFGVVRSEIINLRNDLSIKFRQKLIEECGFEVFISLSKRC